MARKPGQGTTFTKAASGKEWSVWELDIELELEGEGGRGIEGRGQALELSVYLPRWGAAIRPSSSAPPTLHF